MIVIVLLITKSLYLFRIIINNNMDIHTGPWKDRFEGNKDRD